MDSNRLRTATIFWQVHILGHIPPGHVDCVRVWSANFNAIVGRYSHIIAGQFYGHTHLDEFQLFFSKNEKESTAMQVVHSCIEIVRLSTHVSDTRCFF